MAPDGPRYATGERLAVPNSVGTEPPRVPVPVGAVDAHHHIYDPRFPETSGQTRGIGTVDQYALLKRRLGVQRSVVVAPNVYNRDNDCLLDALDRFGDDARGVAIVQPDVTDAELDRLHRRRVRGIRLYLHRHIWAPEDMRRMSRRLADRGWVIEIQPGHADNVAATEDLLASLACDVVLDHFGYIPQPEGTAHPAAAAIFRLIDTGRTWMKLSGNYYTSKDGFPDYADLNVLARAFVAMRADRMLWGTDWPHSRKVIPDDARLLDQLALWAPDEADRIAILVDNPRRLFWST